MGLLGLVKIGTVVSPCHSKERGKAAPLVICARFQLRPFLFCERHIYVVLVLCFAFWFSWHDSDLITACSHCQQNLQQSSLTSLRAMLNLRHVHPRSHLAIRRHLALLG